MTQTLRSLSESYPASSEAERDPEEDRLERAFLAWNRRLNDSRSQTPRITPEMRAERWALYAHECRQLFSQAKVPDRFSTVDLHKLPDWSPDGYRDLAQLLLTLREVQPDGAARIIAIGGDRGRGKTALACGLIRDFCRLGRSALYARVRDYFDALDGVPWEEKPRVKQKYQMPELLVMDEVQVRDAGKAWQDNELTHLIDHRYGAGLVTVLLSNLKPGALTANLGESINRRLGEGYGIVETDWPLLSALWSASDRA